MNSDMIKPEIFGHLHLVYHFTVPMVQLFHEILYFQKSCNLIDQVDLDQQNLRTFPDIILEWKVKYHNNCPFIIFSRKSNVKIFKK